MDVNGHIQTAIGQAQSGQMAEALRTMQEAAGAHPDSAQVHGFLGTLFNQIGRNGEAVAHLRRAYEIAPNVAIVAFQLGAVLVAMDRPMEGLPFMQRAIDIEGTWMPGLLGFARALNGVGDFDRCEVVYRKALEVDSANAEALTGLAGVFMVCGRQREAVELFRRAGQLHSNDVNVAGKLLSALNYAADATPEEVFEAHKRWGSLVGAPETVRFTNAREPDKRLRVGLLSTDLWEHSVAYFLRPLLEARPRDRWEAVCYSVGGRTDWMTEHLRRASDGWVDVSRLDERALVDKIRGDGIDVLLDLSGHTALGPLAALRRRAAPVQATYLGYPNTTGLPTMDWRIVDAITDPEGAERWHTERLARLDGCFLCYSPPEHAPEPREEGWHTGWGVQETRPRRPWTITFGSFNHVRKIGPEVLEAWSRVLRDTPGSGIVLKARGISTPAAKRNVLAEFSRHGVGPDRVAVVEAVSDKREHLLMYHDVDVALDTFPYNGTTTTCEAMWMGVPVVTVEGRTHAGRVGASLLRAVGLPQCVGANTEDFVRIGAELGNDGGKRGEVRRGLRERMQKSPLCDAVGMSRRFEGALRMMWRDWCARA